MLLQLGLECYTDDHSGNSASARSENYTLTPCKKSTNSGAQPDAGQLFLGGVLYRNWSWGREESMQIHDFLKDFLHGLGRILQKGTLKWKLAEGSFMVHSPVSLGSSSQFPGLRSSRLWG